MCWQLLARIPSALVEGDNIGPQDVCWANADWARAHPCGLAVCRRTWPSKSRLALKGAPRAYVRSQTTPYGARSPACSKVAREPSRNQQSPSEATPDVLREGVG
jgi:hypothetical protein